MKPVENKIAIVTGAANGIGQAIGTQHFTRALLPWMIPQNAVYHHFLNPVPGHPSHTCRINNTFLGRVGLPREIGLAALSWLRRNRRM